MGACTSARYNGQRVKWIEQTFGAKRGFIICLVSCILIYVYKLHVWKGILNNLNNIFVLGPNEVWLYIHFINSFLFLYLKHANKIT